MNMRNRILSWLYLGILQLIMFGCAIDINSYDEVKTDISDPFVTVWDTNRTGASKNNQIMINTKKYSSNDSHQFTYDFNIDWGDGNTDEHVRETIVHTYAIPGIYTLKITGVFPQIYFESTRKIDRTRVTDNDLNKTVGTENNMSVMLAGLNPKSDPAKLLTIEHWGDNKWSSMEDAFNGCENLEDHADDVPDLSETRMLIYMFKDAKKYNGRIRLYCDDKYYGAPCDLGPEKINIKSGRRDKINNIVYWDISKVQETRGMFSGAENFNQDIGQWDTSNILNMSNMFKNAKNFNQYIGDWSTFACGNMANMFFAAEKFNQNLSDWNTSNVQDMSGMFRAAKNFNQPLGNWDISDVNSTHTMFSGAKKFNQPLNSWNTGEVLNMRAMFAGAKNFNQNLGNWNTSKVSDMSFMFAGALNYQKPEYIYVKGIGYIKKIKSISRWYTSNVNNTAGMFYYTEYFNDNIGNWNMSQVFDMSSMFRRATEFNQPLNSWNTSEVNKTMGMFMRAEKFNQDLNSWDMSQNKNMAFMFQGAKQFNGDISSWQTGEVESMQAMFLEAESFYGDISAWETGNVKNMGAMFAGAKKFNSPVGDWDMRKVRSIKASDLNKPFEDFNQTLIDRDPDIEFTNQKGTPDINLSQVARVTTKSTGISFMFAGAENFDQDLCGWDLREVTDMTAVFALAKEFNGCVNEWNTAGVDSMEGMFFGAEKFNEPLDKWDTSEVLNISLMFGKASKFNQNLNTWDTAKIGFGTSPYVAINDDKEKKYDGAWSSVLDVIEKFAGGDMEAFDGHNTYGMLGTFYMAKDFNGNIRSWETGYVEDMHMMFAGAKSFNIPIGGWNMSKVTDMSFMFQGAKDFNQSIGGWDTRKVNSMEGMFTGALSFDQNIGNWSVLNTDISHMFAGAGLSHGNYYSILQNWGAQEKDKVFDAGTSQYTTCDEAKARDKLSNIDGCEEDDGWSISDGGSVSTYLMIPSRDENGTVEVDEDNNTVYINKCDWWCPIL